MMVGVSDQEHGAGPLEDHEVGDPTQPLSVGRFTSGPSEDPAPPPAPTPGPPAAPGRSDLGPAPSWVPPAPAPWPAFPAPGTRPMPVGPPHQSGPTHQAGRPRSSVGARTWLGLATLALVVGVAGGVGGSIAHDRLQGPDDLLGTVDGGIRAVDTESLPPLSVDDGSVAAVAQELLPSTVQISAEFEGQAGGATGSGFVLDRQGHIVTNNHVVADAAESEGAIQIVDEEGNRYDATVVGRSPVYDLAVLFSEDAEGLRPASLGSSEKLRVGEGVVAIGSPLGLSSTVTSGIVSALRRPVTTGETADESSYINAVQTDAAINPGNSGGPLVNLRGQVVGVNSAIATSGGGTFSGEAGNIGVGFAIPIEQVIITSDQILKSGKASYPVIGAQVQTGGLGGDGALIDEVLSDTPAEQAGLEKGDVVVAVEGERVTDGKGLIVAIRSHQPGETIEFTFTRDGREQKARVTLGAETG